MSTVLPEAYYDSLELSHKLTGFIGSFRFEEIYLFSYFSLLLYLYKGNPLANWKYKFLADQKSLPYAADLNACLERHISIGNVDRMDNGLCCITSNGLQDLLKIRELQLFKQRCVFIEAACTAGVAVSYRDSFVALMKEPYLEHASLMAKENSNIWIIDHDDYSNVYHDFAEISSKIGISTANLLVPAVTWINYLIEKNLQKESNS